MGFAELFRHRFSTSQEAVESCQRLAHSQGFSVRIRTSKANTVYIVCSKEGKPEHRNIEPKKRNRNSERCHCGWRVVLYFNPTVNSSLKWEFRAGKSMAHNHQLAFPTPDPRSLSSPANYFHGFMPYPPPVQREFPPLPIKLQSDVKLPSIHTLLGYQPPFSRSSSLSDSDPRSPLAFKIDPYAPFDLDYR